MIKVEGKAPSSGQRGIFHIPTIRLPAYDHLFTFVFYDDGGGVNEGADSDDTADIDDDVADVSDVADVDDLVMTTQVVDVRSTSINWDRFWWVELLLSEWNQGHCYCRQAQHQPHNEQQINSQGSDANAGRNILGTHAWVDLERTYWMTRSLMMII